MEKLLKNATNAEPFFPQRYSSGSQTSPVLFDLPDHFLK
jgi:hypothetical protein